MLRNFILFISSLFVSVIFLEIISHIYVIIFQIDIPNTKEEYVESPERAKRFDPELGWSLKPNFTRDDVTINNMGLRSSIDNITEECKSKKLVIILGDSMVYGPGERQQNIFSEVLNRKFSGFCFINTGVEGYSTAQEYLYLERNIDFFKPAIILLFYTQANDMWMNGRRFQFNPYFDTINDKLVYHPPTRRRSVPLYEHSYMFKLINNKFLKGRDILYVFNRLEFLFRREKSQPWVVTRMLLHEIGNLSRKYKTQLFIIDIPTMNQLSGYTKDFKRQQMLEQASIEEGFIYYNLIDFYPENYKTLFIHNDSHWNRHGHDFIANFVATIILEIGD